MKQSRATGTMRNWFAFTTTLLVGCFFSCQAPPPPPDVLATTSLGPIATAELEALILTLDDDQRAPGPGQDLVTWRQDLLEKLIESRALEAEAGDLGLAETEDGLSRLLAARESLLARTMASRMLEPRVRVTEADLRAFYDTHPEEFSHPDQIRVRNIFRRVDRDAAPEVRDQARREVDGWLHEIRRGARFEDLAKAHSDSETASLGGLIGRVDRGQLDPALEEILWALDEGEVSHVIPTPVGFHLFRVDDHIGEFSMPFDDARTRLQRRLAREANEAAEVEILEELVEASGALYAPEHLRSRELDAVLFELDGDDLTLSEFHDFLFASGFAVARELPVEQRLGQLVRERLVLWEAERVGLETEPAIARQLEEIERTTLVAMAHERRFEALLEQVDETVLRTVWSENERRFQTPQLIELSLLMRDFPIEGTWYTVFEELQQLAEEIRGGRQDFAEAARESSMDFAASRGGSTGPLRPDAFADWAGPQAQSAVLDLSIGEISDPILIERFNNNRLTYDRAGYALVRLDSLIEPKSRSFEESRDAVVELYLEREGADLERRVRREVLESVDAVILSERL